MGVWRIDVFSNDDALDFLDLIVGSAAEEVSTHLSNAMLLVTESKGYIEVTDMDNALAAATLVVLKSNQKIKTTNHEALQALEHVDPTQKLRTLAAQTFNRAFQPNDNEWYGLWEDAGKLEAVRHSLQPYIEQTSYKQS